MNYKRNLIIFGFCIVSVLIIIIHTTISGGDVENLFIKKEINALNQEYRALQQRIIDTHTELSIYYFYLGDNFLSKKYFDTAIELESELEKVNIHIRP